MSTEALQLEVVALTDLKPHPRNYRGHPEGQVDHIKRSIEDFGVYRNVVCAKDGTLLAGHGVVEAARQLGRESIAVKRLDLAPDDPKAIKLLLIDNLLPLFAEDDDAAISGLLESIAGEDETAAALLKEISLGDWAGPPADDPDKIGDYDPSDETFSVRIDGVKASDKENVVTLVEDAVRSASLDYQVKVF